MSYQILSIRATAILTVDGIMSDAVDVGAMSRDSRVPGLLHISGDPELMEVARHRKTVKLDLLGLKFRARVAGHFKESGILLVASEPLFRAMAKHLKTLGDYEQL
jgi:hypothetical protein